MSPPSVLQCGSQAKSLNKRDNILRLNPSLLVLKVEEDPEPWHLVGPRSWKGKENDTLGSRVSRSDARSHPQAQ